MNVNMSADDAATPLVEEEDLIDDNEQSGKLRGVIIFDKKANSSQTRFNYSKLSLKLNKVGYLTT